MSVRDFLNNNSAVVTVAAVLLLIVSLFLLMKSCGGPEVPPTITQHWYYDLNTGELFPGPAMEFAPIEAPSGQPHKLPGGSEIPAGVKAHVFACGDCSDEAARFVGYLEMYTPEAQAQLREARQKAETDPSAPEAYMMYEEGLIQGRLIRAGEASDGQQPPMWFPAESEQGVGVISALSKRCPRDDKSKRLKPCYPEGQGE